MDLATWLFKNKVSQTDLAKMMGITRTTIVYYLCGRSMPNEKNVQKILEITDGKVTEKDLRKGRPFRDYICPTCKRKRRVKRKPKQGELFDE